MKTTALLSILTLAITGLAGAAMADDRGHRGKAHQAERHHKGNADHYFKRNSQHQKFYKHDDRNRHKARHHHHRKRHHAHHRDKRVIVVAPQVHAPRHHVRPHPHRRAEYRYVNRHHPHGLKIIASYVVPRVHTFYYDGAHFHPRSCHRMFFTKYRHGKRAEFSEVVCTNRYNRSVVVPDTRQFEGWVF